MDEYAIICYSVKLVQNTAWKQVEYDYVKKYPDNIFWFAYSYELEREENIVNLNILPTDETTYTSNGNTVWVAPDVITYDSPPDICVWRNDGFDILSLAVETNTAPNPPQKSLVGTYLSDGSRITIYGNVYQSIGWCFIQPFVNGAALTPKTEGSQTKYLASRIDIAIKYYTYSSYYQRYDERTATIGFNGQLLLDSSTINLRNDRVSVAETKTRIEKIMGDI